jgi:hypothetical protein
MFFKGTLHITAITESGWALKALLAKYSIGFGHYSMAIDNPHDMVTKVMAQSEKSDDLVQRLDILGHGSASGIQVGFHFVEASNVKNYGPEFMRLRKVLSGESIVFLRGCRVGQNEKLLIALAVMFGTVVYAGTSDENVVLDANLGGEIVKAYPSGSVYRNVPRP